MTDSSTNDNSPEMNSDMSDPAIEAILDLKAMIDADAERDQMDANTLRRISNWIAACLSVALEETGKPEPDRWRLDGLILAADCLNDNIALVLQPAP